MVSILMLGSIVGCGNRNTALENRNINQSINQGTNQRNYTTALRDGVYLGAGNRSTNGNQAAIVTVKGGKITDVALKSIDAEGREINQDRTITGTTGGNTVGNAVGNTGGTLGGDMNGTQGGTSNGNMNRNDAVGGTVGGTTGGGSTAATVDQIRRDLASAMVQKQNYDVKVGGDNMASSTINNWILAARRAIESARR
jgi:hypothetical protein